MDLGERTIATELSHQQLRLVDRSLDRLERRALVSGQSVGLQNPSTRIGRVADHPHEQIAPVILQRAVGNLTIDGDATNAVELLQSVVGRRNRANAVHSVAVGDWRVAIRTADDFGGHLGESDADRADFCAEDLAAVERLASRDGVVESLVVDELWTRDQRRMSKME